MHILPGLAANLSLRRGSAITILFSAFVLLATAQHASTQVKPEPDLGAIATRALGSRTGTIIVVDPKTGRLVRRTGNGADIQFETSPFQTAQIITTYAALDAGLVTRTTSISCKELSDSVTIDVALGRNCQSVFRELSTKLTIDQFKRAADTLGFVYYGVDRSMTETGAVRPISASIILHPKPEEFAELAALGQGMRAKELHFASLVSTIASGTSSYDRFVAFVQRAAKAPVPPADRLNMRALEAIRLGMTKSVDHGEASAAATLGEGVAAMGGGDGENAILIAYAPARSARIALVVRLINGSQRDAAEVAGKFLRDYFTQEKSK